jgi:hypothetical protein
MPAWVLTDRSSVCGEVLTDRSSEVLIDRSSVCGEVLTDRSSDVFLMAALPMQEVLTDRSSVCGEVWTDRSSEVLTDRSSVCGEVFTVFKGRGFADGDFANARGFDRPQQRLCICALQQNWNCAFVSLPLPQTPASRETLPITSQNTAFCIYVYICIYICIYIYIYIYT